MNIPFYYIYIRTESCPIKIQWASSTKSRNTSYPQQMIVVLFTISFSRWNTLQRIVSRRPSVRAAEIGIFVSSLLLCCGAPAAMPLASQRFYLVFHQWLRDKRGDPHYMPKLYLQKMSGQLITMNPWFTSASGHRYTSESCLFNGWRISSSWTGGYHNQNIVLGFFHQHLFPAL